MSFKIDKRKIGPDFLPYIIAELSGNHNGNINRAFAIMEAAKSAGADAVKLQTYTADTITIDHDGPGFLIEEGLWKGRSLYELYQEASTPWDWHAALFDKGRELGITVFSSPFDESAVDFLELLECPAYKIASFEAMDFQLLKKVAATGKPVIVSTGMVTYEEVEELVDCLNVFGSSKLALLHCVSSYPALPESSNLRTIASLNKQFNVVAGLSDHTLGTPVAVAAVAHGAAIIEKHVTLSRAEGGVDSAFSLEPSELKKLVDDCKIAWLANGEIKIGRQEAAEPNIKFRRSLYIVDSIPAGGILTAENLRSIRPGYGLDPKHFEKVLGSKVKRSVAKGTPLDWDLIL